MDLGQSAVPMSRPAEPQPPEPSPRVDLPNSGVADPPAEDAQRRLHQLRQTRLKPDAAASSAHPGPLAPAYGTLGGDEEWMTAGPADAGEGAAPTAHLRTGRRRKTRLGRWLDRPPFRLGLSAVGAIVLGLMFGYAIMTVFQEEQLYQAYRTVLDGTVQTLTAPAGPLAVQGDGSEIKGGGTPETGAEVDKPLTLPELRMYVVQVGVFTSEETARPIIDALTREGFPHWRYDDGEKLHILVGAAPSRDDILGIASALTRKQMDAYVKELALPGGELALVSSPSASDVSGTVQADRMGAFAAAGLEGAEALAAWSGRVLAGSRPDAGALAEEAERVKQLHLRFLEESRAVEAAAPETWKPHIAGMVSGLNRAVTALDQVREANLDSHAWQVQAGVAAYLEHYAKLLAQAVR